MKFRIWLEDMQSEKEKSIRSLFFGVFKALGIDGQAPNDNYNKSLSTITSGRPEDGSTGNNEFKGKKAAAKRLENYGIFRDLEAADPAMRASVENTRKWLGSSEGSENGKADINSNASTTVGELLKNLFGDKYFGRFVGDDHPESDTAKAQVQPQPPKQDTPDNSMNQNSPETLMPPGQPMGGFMALQPQTNASQVTPPPTNPMPSKPAGAEMGLY